MRISSIDNLSPNAQTNTLEIILQMLINLKQISYVSIQLEVFWGILLIK